MSQLKAQSLSVSYGETTILDNLNVEIPEGKVTVFIGKNGCGKSTLLSTFARIQKPVSGSIQLDHQNIRKLSNKKVAQKMALLPQAPVTPEGMTVLQLVKQGRYPYQSWLNQWSEDDEAAVKRSLQVTGIEELVERQVDSLSGGQRQRVWIAMVLAQDTDIILLDEPTTYLDLSHQIEILDLLYDLNKKENRTIVMVLHDLNLACRYADHVIAIQDKKVYAEGPPEEVMNCDLVKNVFDMNVNIVQCPLFGTPMCIPHGKGRHLEAVPAPASVL